MSNSTMMSAQQPTLEQRNNPMHPRQQMLGVRRLVFLDLAVVNITFQFAVSLQAVGHHRAARFDGLDNKAMQRGSVGIGNVPQPDAADAFSVGLGGNDNQGLFDRLAATNSRNDSPLQICAFIGKTASKNLLDTRKRCHYCCH